MCKGKRNGSAREESFGGLLPPTENGGGAALRMDSRSSLGRQPIARRVQAMDAREAWIARHAAEIRAVLADAGVRAELVGILGGDDQEQRRQRRLAELEQELDGMELTLRLRRNHE